MVLHNYNSGLSCELTDLDKHICILDSWGFFVLILRLTHFWLVSACSSWFLVSFRQDFTTLVAFLFSGLRQHGFHGYLKDFQVLIVSLWFTGFCRTKVLFLLHFPYYFEFLWTLANINFAFVKEEEKTKIFQLNEN